MFHKPTTMSRLCRCHPQLSSVGVKRNEQPYPEACISQLRVILPPAPERQLSDCDSILRQSFETALRQAERCCDAGRSKSGVVTAAVGGRVGGGSERATRHTRSAARTSAVTMYVSVARPPSRPAWERRQSLVFSRSSSERGTVCSTSRMPGRSAEEARAARACM